MRFSYLKNRVKYLITRKMNRSKRVLSLRPPTLFDPFYDGLEGLTFLLFLIFCFLFLSLPKSRAAEIQEGVTIPNEDRTLIEFSCSIERALGEPVDKKRCADRANTDGTTLAVSAPQRSRQLWRFDDERTTK